ncbi:hypothetical protein LTR62_005472 [Meristemomyces frigidus]|uniref:Poly [ADP-ribose] polymerase n=1 Tax=Meristemomyces frigidus TaxID=1508187 RepID=A0AAN7TDA4_9PEZI|nr:hypothetical protein LTR62_005472 [Meristemomyces frigidus]
MPPKKRAAQAVVDNESPPQPKRRTRAKTKPAVVYVESDDEAEQSPAPRPAATRSSNPKKSNKQKAKDEEAEELQLKDINPAADGQVASANKNLVIPLDDRCYMSSHRVFVDPESSVIYDANLNQTQSAKNANKFYRVQLLQSKDNYRTWTRWGRVGEPGQSKLLGNGSLDSALEEFEKKFKDKSGLKWENRLDTPKSGKYVFLEKSYEPDDADDGAPLAQTSRSQSPAKCTLHPAVQSLMELIFNEEYFAATMQSYNYDVKKLPLGKLSRTTISRGYQALKDLSALLDAEDDAVAIDAAAIEAAALENAAIEDQSDLYYSLIPHAFGRNKPPVIRNKEMLKQEADLLDSLSDMKEADDLVKVEESGGDEEIHALDIRFNKLGLLEMTPVEPRTQEFEQISQYLMGTCGDTHHFSYHLDDIFRIERNGELDRFEKSPYAGIASDKRLLFHGSRTMNFGGILSQGLRIAPPEAPVNGYAFGKGIYLADMSSKSAGYCSAHSSGGYGLLLLCEAELGNPMYTIPTGDANAEKKAKAKGMFSTHGQGRMAPKGWKDAECIHPSLKGVMLPDTTVAPGDTGIEGGYLQYNEYIAYSVEQVRLRYLLRVRM